MRKLHKEDKEVIVGFIDYSRLETKEDVVLEIKARHLAEHLEVNPNLSNRILANRFATLLDNKTVA